METENNSSKSYKHHSEERDDGELEILKRKISKHPLYEMLLEKHLECLKVGGVSANLDRQARTKLQQQYCHDETNAETFDQTVELDLFMEAYCFALGKLKEAMEEPQTKSLAFINDIHSQLTELKSTDEPAAVAKSVGISSISADYYTVENRYESKSMMETPSSCN